MLKQDRLEAQPQHAAKVRVTPEELVAAITRLQARKDADERQVDGTIQIGEAVQQLGLEATPEEVLAEVEAERQQTKKTQWPSLRQRWGLTVAAFAIALSVIGGRELARQPSDLQDVSVTSPDTAVPAAAAENSVPDLTPYRLQIDPDHLQVGTTSGKLVLMSEVGDNQIFYTRLYGNRDWGDYFPGNPSSTWTLIKHGGQVYLRGWIRRVSVKLLQANGVDVANRRDADHAVSVTLPLAGFKVVPDGSTGETAEFNAEDIRLDKHAFEKWHP